jgi:outer membrane protein assembly factor BamA
MSGPRRLILFLSAIALLLVGCTRMARIEGESDLSDRELLREARRPLQAYASPQGQPADLIDAAEAMRARLDREGFPGATVVAQPGLPPAFAIVEGPRAAIGGIGFSGDLGIAEAELAKAAAGGAWFTSGTPGTVRGRVLRALRMAGHEDAVVEEPIEQWNADRTQVSLSLVVHAGPRFTLTGTRIDLEDAERWPGLLEQLTALLDPPGSPYLPRTASSAAARLRGRLLDLGHREVVIEASKRQGAAPGEVELIFAIQPGPVHTLHALTIQGGLRSASRFINERLRGLQAGRPLSQSAIDESVTALMSTGLFRRVEVLPTAGAQQPDGTVPDDVQVQLREQATQHIDLALGYGTYERFRAGVTYVDEHLLGRGLRLTTGVDVSMVGWGADASLSDPFRFGPGRRVTLDAAYFERQEPSYAHRELSSGLTFSRKFKLPQDDAQWEGRTGYRFARSEDYRIQAVDVTIDPAQPLYSTSTVRLELRRDSRRPRVIDPDVGTLSRAGVAWSAAPLGATVDYTEVTGEWSGAWSPAPWLVAAVRGAFATRDPGVVESLPIGEHLFMGGADTVRSFSQDDLGPRAANGEPLGGLTSAVANIEMRWRPFEAYREVEIATFYDIGTVDPDAWSLAAPWGSGVGAGLRYRTPVGPIRCDAAIDPYDSFGAQQNWAVNLTVGFAF